MMIIIRSPEGSKGAEFVCVSPLFQKKEIRLFYWILPGYYCVTAARVTAATAPIGI